MKRRTILIGAAVSSIAVGVAILILWMSPKPVDVMHPRIGHAITAVYGSGTVEAAVMMPVAPRTGARIVELDSDEGQTVVKGQKLARLEDDDMRSNVEQLQAQERFAAGDFKRNAALLHENAIARQTYDRAKSTWEMARAAVKQALAQTGFMMLVSPGNCYVIQRDGEIGQFIAANTPLFWISCDGKLRVSAEIDEEDVPLVQPGQRVLLRADAFPDKVFEGRVTSVTPKGDPVGRSYRVRIQLPPDCPLRIGMTTEANIISRDEPSAMLLPDTAVVGDRVWRVIDGRASAVAIVKGAKNGNWIEIRSGIARSDIIVVDASRVPASGTIGHVRLGGAP